MRARLIVSATLLILAACAGGDAFTYSAIVSTDQADGKITIRQPPVSAQSGESGDHLLGFEWNQKFPDVVFITAETGWGPRLIQSLTFRVDSRLFENLKPVSLKTDLRRSGVSQRFEMPLADFQIIATSSAVLMRIGGIYDFSVSSFGPGAGNGRAPVNAKFAPFLERIKLAISGAKPQ
jgi:hypothetical protein